MANRQGKRSKDAILSIGVDDDALDHRERIARALCETQRRKFKKGVSNLYQARGFAESGSARIAQRVASLCFKDSYPLG